MSESLSERLADQGSAAEFVRCALTQDDLARYNLPADFTKVTDTRRAAFVAKYGDVAVELDALPPDVLQQRLRLEVEARMDLAALEETRTLERQERELLVRLLSGWDDTSPSK